MLHHTYYWQMLYKGPILNLLSLAWTLSAEPEDSYYVSGIVYKSINQPIVSGSFGHGGTADGRSF